MAKTPLFLRYHCFAGECFKQRKKKSQRVRGEGIHYGTFAKIIDFYHLDKRRKNLTKRQYLEGLKRIK